MIKIPDVIRIGSVDYEVEKTDETIVLNGIECYGLIDNEFHNIELNTELQDSQGLELTFLHELVHGILYSVDLHEFEANEELVNKIAKGLHQVIRDNPNIFICEETEELGEESRGE